MKTKLLFAAMLLSVAGFSQSISAYYGTGEGAYTEISPASVIDQSPAGAQANWAFMNLATIGSVTDTNAVPTAAQLLTYPNSMQAVNTAGTISGDATTSTIFSRSVGNSIFVTGIFSDGLQLSYSTDNASGGTFPMAYGTTVTDAVAGNYVYTTYSGTFTGTLNTNVDAYGNLTLQPANSAVPVAISDVTRIKTEQNLILSYPGFGVVGTITISSYSYYSTLITSNYPVFRTVTTTMVVPLLSINQTKTRVEALSSLLGVNGFEKQRNTVEVVPNPVTDFLNFESQDNQAIRSVTLSDISGRIILSRENPGNKINCGDLRSGVYFATISTDYGTVTRKFVKK